MKYRLRVACGFGFLAMTAMSGGANAAITGPITIDFAALVATSIAGPANLTPLADGSCPTTSRCYYEDGMAVGVADDPVNFGEHLHRYGTGAAAKLQYHADSSGIYLRSKDGSAFSLVQMDFLAGLDGGNNPGYDANYNPLVAGDFWEVLGFNTAVNPDLGVGDGTNYATRVAYQQVSNGFSGALTLDSAFHNINAFWIHFNGYPGVPQDGVSFGMTADNIQLAAPVPLPAAIWSLGSGLLALIAATRKNTRRRFQTQLA